MTKHYPPTYHQYLLENRHNELIAYLKTFTYADSIDVMLNHAKHIVCLWNAKDKTYMINVDVADFECWLNHFEANNPVVDQPQPAPVDTMNNQTLPYHTYLLINGDWLFESDFPTHDAAYRSGEMNCKLFADVRDFKVVETLNYDQPQPAPVDTKAVKSIHTRSGSTELAIQTFIDELQALDSNDMIVDAALLNLADALGHFQAARHSLGVYLRYNQESERVPNIQWYATRHFHFDDTWDILGLFTDCNEAIKAAQKSLYRYGQYSNHYKVWRVDSPEFVQFQPDVDQPQPAPVWNTKGSAE